MTENLKSEQETPQELKEGMKAPVLPKVSIKELKKQEYYVIVLENNKVLARDDMPLLYHKNAWYKSEKLELSVRAYEEAAEEANGKPVRADKVLGNFPNLNEVLVIGKIVKKVF